MAVGRWAKSSLSMEGPAGRCTLLRRLREISIARAACPIVCSGDDCQKHPAYFKAKNLVLMESGRFMLYPACLDAKKTRKGGRKYPAGSTVDNPKYQEVKGALDRLKIGYTAEPTKCHPRDQAVPGRFAIQKRGRRAELVAEIAREVIEDRVRKNSARSGVPNVLNLVPVKKKKGKKSNR